jgi:hypothetical protein
MILIKLTNFYAWTAKTRAIPSPPNLAVGRVSLPPRQISG